MSKPESRWCAQSIDGPKVGYRVVAWRRRCRNKTTDPSGYCHVHRDDGWYLGKRKEAESA